jgi:transcription antitermination factor NusG
MQLSDPGERRWYAIYTRARTEKKVDKQLQDGGVESFLPMRRVLKQWSDRKKWVEEPLLRSYIFVHISEKEYFEVIKTMGVVRFITFSGVAAAIPDWQIDSLKILMTGNEDFEMVRERLEPGDPVEVVSGPLAGFRGEMVEWKGKKSVLLKIESIGLSLTVSVTLSSVKAI